MAGLIPSTDVKELKVDPFMAGAQVAFLIGGQLHVSPAMYAALISETEAAWRSLRVRRVATVKDLTDLKTAVQANITGGESLEWPEGGRKVGIIKETNPA